MTVVLLGMLVLVGCGGASIKTNPAATFPLPVTDDKPAFMFPINISHAGLPGDANAMGLFVTGGVAAKFGKKVVSGQQLFDQVGNLSFELAEQIKAQADANSWKMTGGAEKVANDLSNEMEAILKKLAELGLIKADYKFKYIVAVHSHGKAGTIPKTVSVDTWGGIYDVDTKEILSYIESSDTIAADEIAAKGMLPNAYNNIIATLIAGK